MAIHHCRHCGAIIPYDDSRICPNCDEWAVYRFTYFYSNSVRDYKMEGLTYAE